MKIALELTPKQLAVITDALDTYRDIIVDEDDYEEEVEITDKLVADLEPQVRDLVDRGILKTED